MLHRNVTVYNTFGNQDYNQKTMTLEDAHEHLLDPKNLGTNLRYMDTLSDDPQADVGVSELWGQRKTQEDAVRGELLDEAARSFTFQDWEYVINCACEEVNRLLPAEKSRWNGSCFIGNIITDTHIINFNLGDSETWLIHSKKPRRINSVPCYDDAKRINDLHIYSNREEQERIFKAGGTISDKRVNGFLAVTRSFGDTVHTGSHNGITTELISHTPQIIEQEISRQGDSYLVMACDGLREGLGDSTEKILANKITEFEADGLTPDEIAVRLSKLAFNYGSGDNISVVVIPLSKIASITRKTPLLYFVADGHGGHVVSDFLFNNFISIFKERIELKARQTNQKPAPVSTHSTITSNNFPPLPQIPASQSTRHYNSRVDNPKNKNPAATQKQNDAREKPEPRKTSQDSSRVKNLEPANKVDASEFAPPLPPKIDPDAISAIENYIKSINLQRSRRHTAQRIMDLINNGANYSEEVRIKILKAEYEAMVDYDRTSRQIIHEGPLAKAIRNHLLKIGKENDPRAIFAPKLPFEELIHNSALKLLGYVDETERSFFYKIFYLKWWKPDYAQEYNENLNLAKTLAYKLLTLKTNEELQDFINSNWYSNDSSLNDIIASVKLDIQKRLGKESSKHRINDLKDSITSLTLVPTFLHVTPSRFTRSASDKKQPLLRDELIGKIDYINHNNSMDNRTRRQEIKIVVKQTQRKLNRSTWFFGLFSRHFEEKKFKKTLTELRSKL